MSVLEAALEYVALGWPVFPLKPDNKVPACDKWREAQTTDPAQCERWWGHSKYNIAIATGAPGPDVLDLDNKDGADINTPLRWLREAGLINGAERYVRTRSGGLHLYFCGTAQGNRAGIGGYPIDFRGSGGYVVGPPSVVDGGRYEVIQHPGGQAQLNVARVEGLLRPPEERRVRIPYDGETSVDALAGWLRSEGMKPGRHDRYFWAVCRAIEAGIDDLDELIRAGQSIGLPDPGEGDYLNRTIRDQLKRGGSG